MIIWYDYLIRMAWRISNWVNLVNEWINWLKSVVSKNETSWNIWTVIICRDDWIRQVWLACNFPLSLPPHRATVSPCHRSSQLTMWLNGWNVWMTEWLSGWVTACVNPGAQPDNGTLAALLFCSGPPVCVVWRALAALVLLLPPCTLIACAQKLTRHRLWPTEETALKKARGGERGESRGGARGWQISQHRCICGPRLTFSQVTGHNS